MKIYDAGKVVLGIAVFLAFVTLPVWYNAASGRAGYRPDLEKPVDAKMCVEATPLMRTAHMALLNDWRDQVVRADKRVYVASDGTRHEMSLSRNCLSCHQSKEKFCDRCHDYMGVKPYCWDCHVVPKGAE